MIVWNLRSGGITAKDYKNDEKLFGKVYILFLLFLHRHSIIILSIKIAIVTGANSGIGKEVTKDLSKRGARVIMACRDIESCNKVKQEIMKETFNKNIECVECNLASLESIKMFTEKIKKGLKTLSY